MKSFAYGCLGILFLTVAFQLGACQSEATRPMAPGAITDVVAVSSGEGGTPLVAVIRGGDVYRRAGAEWSRLSTVPGINSEIVAAQVVNGTIYVFEKDGTFHRLVNGQWTEESIWRQPS